MKILVDTSVWVQFLSHEEAGLRNLLLEGGVLIHPFIIGEIACGSLKNRKATISLLQSLPTIETCSDEEVLHLLEKHRLYAKGVGWVDLHLLASSIISNKQLWTLDNKLNILAKQFFVAP
jgi:predicted nucleic acid-binding protein